MDADAAVAARYRVQDARVAILLSMALISMHDASLGGGAFLYEAAGAISPISTLQVCR